MKTYTVKPSASKAAAEQKRAETARNLSLGQWEGGPIISSAQLAGALVAKGEAEKLIKQFTVAAKAWVDEHGPVTGADGRTWGPVTTEREHAVGLKLGEMLDLLHDCGVAVTKVEKVESALRRRGIGEIMIGKRYGWTK